MHDSLLVAVLDGQQHLMHNQTGSFLADGLLIPQQLQSVRTLQVLSDDVHAGLVLEHLVYFEDIRMVLPNRGSTSSLSMSY